MSLLHASDVQLLIGLDCGLAQPMCLEVGHATRPVFAFQDEVLSQYSYTANILAELLASSTMRGMLW